MPKPTKYDCYTTGLLSDEEIQYKKDHMDLSLFSANYELKHRADSDVIFEPKKERADISAVMNGLAHVDSAFYGEDYTALTVMQKHDGKYYVFGKIWRKHVEDCYADIKRWYDYLLVSKLYNEKNADKGLVAKAMRKTYGMKVVTYHEDMNKHIKITTCLKAIWKEVVIVEGTDEEYIKQIEDYTENAEHDDAPDSCSCLARIMKKKK
jgi:predicted phage terminase large subunit-like protein